MRSTNTKRATIKPVPMEQVIKEVLSTMPAERYEWVCRTAKQHGLSPDFFVYSVMLRIASSPTLRKAVEQAAIRKAARNYQ